MSNETTTQQEQCAMSPEKAAMAAGFTAQVSASSAQHDLSLLVRANTDYDSTFKAFCLDEEEFINVNGWLFDIESV